MVACVCSCRCCSVRDPGDGSVLLFVPRLKHSFVILFLWMLPFVLLPGRLMWTAILSCRSKFSKWRVRRSVLLFRLSLASVVAGAAALVAGRPRADLRLHQAPLRTIVGRARRLLPAVPRPRTLLSCEAMTLRHCLRWAPLITAVLGQPAMTGLVLAAGRRARALRLRVVLALVTLFMRSPLTRDLFVVGRLHPSAQ